MFCDLVYHMGYLQALAVIQRLNKSQAITAFQGS
jgi:hypothetical protein